jgi:surface antigen
MESLSKLKAAKQEVNSKRDTVAAVLKEGASMKDMLEKKRKEKEEILARTRYQQKLYADFIKQRNQLIAKLGAQQRSANQQFFASGELIEGSPDNGGYPEKLNKAPMDSLVDPWGMYNRECVSYTAWKIEQTTGKMPYWGGRGNANQWPSSARADGIPVGDKPKEGAIAIAFIGPFGHSMYVEKVLENGKIHVSEYNYFIDGTYTERIIPSSGLTYIYFPKNK